MGRNKVSLSPPPVGRVPFVVSHDHDPHSSRQQAEQKVVWKPIKINTTEIPTRQMRAARVLCRRLNCRS